MLKKHPASGTGNGEAKKIDTPNDPLVLHVDTIEFEPDIHYERRKLTIDFEINQEQQKQLIDAIYARQKLPMPRTMRIRFVGRPV